MTVRHLTWAHFDAAVIQIARHVVDCEAIYGVPRGGLPLAVALSHRTGLPLAGSVWPKTFVVDDIADTGETLSGLSTAPLDLTRTAVWVRRASCKLDVLSAYLEVTDAWIVFPWEDPRRAEDDYRYYMERHGHGQASG